MNQMSLFKKNKYIMGIGALVLVCVTVLTVYLTPLKFLNIVPPTMHEMDPKDFYVQFKAHPERYEFIDVRSPSVYLSAHAQGAISIPIKNLYEEHYVLPRSGKQLVLICTTGRLAAVAYGYLQYWGFLNLIHLQGGLQTWTNEGLPIEGSNVSPILRKAVIPISGDEHQ